MAEDKQAEELMAWTTKYLLPYLITVIPIFAFCLIKAITVELLSQNRWAFEQSSTDTIIAQSAY